MRRRLTPAVVLVVVLAVSFNATVSFACGPFEMSAVFVYTVHPAYPLERFAAGEIGMVQPDYARSYLFVAYRYLAGSSFNSAEQKALTELWQDRLTFGWSLGEEEWIKAWLAAREKVSGLSTPQKIEVYRSREKPNEYETYVNCRKDSFETAITTLNERIAKYGADNQIVRTWVEGQDQVFANCAEGQHLPTELPAGADSLTRADRAYQIASANFYAGAFAEANQRFAAIASDSTSPWQKLAPYLIARTLVRKASLGPTETSQQALNEAEAQLKKILADRQLAGTHAASQRLLNLVRLRLHPADRMQELARILATQTPNENLKQDLWDYTTLLDGVLEKDDLQWANIPATARGDDLTDWISTFQSDSEEAFAHAVARWQATKSMPWLIAAMTGTDGKDPNTNALIAHALTVAPGSPAFPTTRVHAVRLLSEAGKVEEARTLADQLLTNNRGQFDTSALNALLGQRMLLARDLSELLKFAPRVPASLSWNDDGREIPAEDSEISDESKAVKGKPLFDVDATRIFNRQLPLAILKTAATSQTLPVELRRDVAQAAWLRAVLLGDYNTADQMVPTLSNLVPELVVSLGQFKATTQPDAKQFAAIYTWLKFPGLEPIVDTGIGRRTPLNKQDTYRDNWWCSSSFSPSEDEEKSQELPRAPVFLNLAEVALGAKESSDLAKLGAAPNYISRNVVTWVTKNPTDPRAAEALHLAVNTTRYGCTDKDTGRWSKAAFDLLHRNYPKSTWARKTPYWFKD